MLARRWPVVVVGPELARQYGRARRLLAIPVSLVSEGDIVPAEVALRRRYDGELRLLSVGRLEAEKNPLLLADVLARLRAAEPRWRLVVCGEGPMAAELEERLRALSLHAHADLRGFLPLRGGLDQLYRDSHVFLHVSFTEGVPQVLFEAFAAGLPVVATAVGGVPGAVGDSALLVPPGSPEAAADAVARVAADPALRERLVASGIELARTTTLEAGARRLAAFLGVAGGSAAVAVAPALEATDA